MRPLVILKTGDTLPGIGEVRGDFDDWILPVLGWAEAEVQVVEAHRGEFLPAVNEVSGTIVTGSPAMVTDREPWSERSAQWLAELVAATTPILAICYGHQLLAHGLDGEVGKNPRGREIGTVCVELIDHHNDPLFAGVAPEFPAHATHVESVLRLPTGAHLLARNDLDEHHAFRIGPNAWGVQFHPEFDADIMRRYIDARRDLIAEEGLDADHLSASVSETPASSALIERFGELVRQRELGRS